jgi:hypothetical protein
MTSSTPGGAGRRSTPTRNGTRIHAAAVDGTSPTTATNEVRGKDTTLMTQTGVG